MTICYNENNEYILFDSYIDMDEDILFKVEKKGNFYKFPGIIVDSLSSEATPST